METFFMFAQEYGWVTRGTSIPLVSWGFLLWIAYVISYERLAIIVAVYRKCACVCAYSMLMKFTQLCAKANSTKQLY